MNFRPLGDRVLIKALEDFEQKVGGIIIPDTAKERPQKGEVVAAGDGRRTDEGKRVALEVKPGDKILFGKYSGTEIRLDDEDYLILSESEILARL
jgi:chaperonin GroES